jgi:hypothetical protein
MVDSNPAITVPAVAIKVLLVFLCPFVRSKFILCRLCSMAVSLSCRPLYLSAQRSTCASRFCFSSSVVLLILLPLFFVVICLGVPGCALICIYLVCSPMYENSVFLNCGSLVMKAEEGNVIVSLQKFTIGTLSKSFIS